MNKAIKNRLRKKEILTIPNLLSFFRIMLIPVMVTLYCQDRNYIGSVAVIALSGLTDMADGKIARKFNMISDFGKFLDPLADHLTQAAMILCLITRYPYIAWLVVIFAVKELVLLICGLFRLKSTDTVTGARWYGKVTTTVIYGSMILLFLLPSIPAVLAQCLIILCGIVITGSLVLYGRYYYRILKTN